MSAMRFCAERAHGLDRERKDAAAGLDRDLAEDRMRAPLDLVVERGVVQRGDPLGLGGLDHADEARSLAGQRHQRERAALGVEFGRGVVMRPAWREIEGQRGLRIAAAVALDAGGGAAERAPAVGADDEPRGDAVAAVASDDGHAGFVRLDRAALRPRSASATAASRARASSAASRCRFSMLWPNASRPISDAAKRTSGARTSRAVASTIRITRSGAACAAQPSQTPSVSSAVTEPASSAVVRWSGAGRPRDQRGFDAGLGERDGGGQPGRAAADDRHFDG